MSLDKIKHGTRILVDSNIFIYWLTHQSSQCGKFLRRCAEKHIEGYISVLSLTEVLHRLMMLEAKESGWAKGRNIVRSLQSRPERVRALTRYEDWFRDILRLRLHVEALSLVDLIESLTIRRQYGLLTNNSILLAVALRLGIKNIASADKTLERATTYRVYAPSDLKV